MHLSRKAVFFASSALSTRRFAFSAASSVRPAQSCGSVKPINYNPYTLKSAPWDLNPEPRTGSQRVVAEAYGAGFRV